MKTRPMTYEELMAVLNELLETADNRGRMDGPHDHAVMEFVVAWFEMYGDRVKDFMEGEK